MPSYQLSGEDLPEGQHHKLQRIDRIISERMQIPASLSLTNRRSENRNLFLLIAASTVEDADILGFGAVVLFGET